MRLKACLGIVLLGTGACTYVPDALRVELGGSTLQFAKKPVAPPPEAPPPDEAQPEAQVPEAPSADAPRG
jgi:hypothetical protein